MEANDDKMRALIDAIVASAQGSNGAPVLPTGSRPLLEAWLERLLVERQLLREHIRRLQDTLGTQFRYTDAPSEEKIQAVLAGQWRKLADRDLATLVLNPPALCCLQSLIDEEMPAAWLPAMERYGRQLMAEHGRSVPKLDELVKASEARTFLETRRRRRRRWLQLLGGGGAIAAAAVIAYCLLWPAPIGLDVKVEAYWPRATRGSQAPPADDLGSFTVRIITSEPVHVYFIVRYASGGLWIKKVTDDEYSVLLKGEGSFEYDLWDDPPDEPDQGLLLSTHVVIIAAREALTREDLVRDVPDEILADSDEDLMRKFEEFAERLQAKYGCVVVIKSIEPAEAQ